ncbi:PIN domain-containing protein [Thermanaerosceptrum fracticalcis]|uniref:Ribonuclease VapC n=1 Tax=Thermanaerosceptrum fracticalcis TaxID=1712410 RepID=A0A7G6E6F6_THEFR|nr:type II toxin-antitoxin system VapC family toxin [Thermanaerosceptrum fracticalcis]QNB47660.1 PIN domain-containing protein [Thermanaerosceptrum fracticalcis]
MRYMLDTNICIYIIKKKPVQVFQIFNALKVGDVCISSITLAELQYGVYKSQFPERNKLALVNFLAPITILPFSDRASVLYGHIRAGLEKRGQIIGAYDLMIAAHALSEDLILVTNNTKEFSRIPNLPLKNWAE